MKLIGNQKTWFDKVRQEWQVNVQSQMGAMGAQVFDVPKKVKSSSVTDARLFASRVEALDFFPKGGVVAEIGTQAGWFARQILDRVNPAQLHLFDLEFETLANSHLDVTEDKRVILHRGDSSNNLETLPDGMFDWIYVDGNHYYEGVRKDTLVGSQKIKNDGLLVFNDYTVWSPLELIDYGVVQVVNDLLCDGKWTVSYLALHPMMYCDIAIKRR